MGLEIGPDLRALSDLSGVSLLTSILDPNRAVEPHYVAYLCTLTDGRQIHGLISAETTASITLKLQDGTQPSILRSDIKALRSTNISLMPEGLETALTKQDLSDLLQFLQAKR